MPYFNASRHPSTSPLPRFEPFAPFDDSSSVLSNTTPRLDSAQKRRKWFGDEGHRKAATFTPDVRPPSSPFTLLLQHLTRTVCACHFQTVVQFDFAYGYFQFPELHLGLPGGISFDLKKYWRNYPARFVCCGRGENGVGPGELFFVVQFNVPTLDPDSEPETSSWFGFSS